MLSADLETISAIFGGGKTEVVIVLNGYTLSSFSIHSADCGAKSSRVYGFFVAVDRGSSVIGQW